MQNQLQYQLEQQQFQIKLTKTFYKVYKILPSFEHTFVVLGCLSVGKDTLVHVRNNGNVIFQHTFQHYVDSMAMVSDYQVLVLETRNSCITIFNLKIREIVQTPFNFVREESDLSQIFTFNKNKNICVVQSGTFNDQRFKLSYFTTPLTPQSRPFSVYQSDSQWNHEHIVKKANQDSLIVWYKHRQDSQFTIKSYGIQQGKGVFNVYKLKNQIGQAYNHQDQIKTAIINLWQIEAGKFLLACITQKLNLDLKNKDGIVNNNFVWDVINQNIRQTKFYFEEKYAYQLIDIHAFGEYSIFRTYNYQNGQSQESPCYYVHNKTQDIVTKNQWVCSYLVKWEYPGFAPIIVKNQYENGDVNCFKVTLIRVVEKN